jgi:membrane-associated phospholipid phosphatase
MLFDRIRPQYLDLRIAPAITTPAHASYPSGHSTQAFLLAFILAKLENQNAQELLCDAWEIAYNRELLGVHYQSDREAGIVLAGQLLTLLKRDPKFVNLLVDAKKWWAFNQVKPSKSKLSQDSKRNFGQCDVHSIVSLEWVKLF